MADKRIFILDTLVINTEFRHRGYGRYLFEASLADKLTLYDQVELRVMHDNYPALNFYQSLGFGIVSADVWLSRPRPFSE